jgi:hypothetical protein
MNYTISTNINKQQVSLSVGTSYGMTFHDFQLKQGGDVIIEDKTKFKLIAKCCKTSTDILLYFLTISYEQAFNQDEDLILNNKQLHKIY